MILQIPYGCWASRCCLRCAEYCLWCPGRDRGRSVAQPIRLLDGEMWAGFGQGFALRLIAGPLALARSIAGRACAVCPGRRPDPVPGTAAPAAGGCRPGCRRSPGLRRALGRRFELVLTPTRACSAAACCWTTTCSAAAVDGAPDSWVRLTRRGDRLSGMFFDGAEHYAIEPWADIAALAATGGDNAAKPTRSTACATCCCRWALPAVGRHCRRKWFAATWPSPSSARS